MLSLLVGWDADSVRQWLTGRDQLADHAHSDDPQSFVALMHADRLPGK